MSPAVRRALHEALDLVLDAVAEDGRATLPARRKREPVREAPRKVDEVTLRRALEAGRKAGLL